MTFPRAFLRWAALPVALLAVSCTKAPRSGGAAAGAAPERAVVVFVSGDVEAAGAAGSTTVAVGDALEAGRKLVTGAGSECELRLGGGAIVRIEEKTELVLDEAILASGGNRVGIHLALGGVRCKVAKLAGDERFRIRTPTAMLGVRGTDFGVTVSARGDTRLEVREGAVAILPASIDLEAIAARLSSDDPEISAALAELANAELLVHEAEQAVVTEAAFRNAAETRERIERAIASISGTERPTAAQVQAFASAIRNAASEIRGSMAAPAGSPAPSAEQAPSAAAAQVPSTAPAAPTAAAAPAAAAEPALSAAAGPVESSRPIAIAVRNGSFEQPVGASGDMTAPAEWTAGGSWYGRVAKAPVVARNGSAFVWASYARGGPQNGFSQELEILCLPGRYTLAVWINADARGLQSRIELGYDAGYDEYRLIAADARTAPYGHDADGGWGRGWIQQTLAVDVREEDPWVGRPLWLRLTNTTGARPKRVTDEVYGDSVSWDGVTLTFSPADEHGE